MLVKKKHISRITCHPSHRAGGDSPSPWKAQVKCRPSEGKLVSTRGMSDQTRDRGGITAPQTLSGLVISQRLNMTLKIVHF